MLLDFIIENVQDIFRVLITGFVGYVALIVLLRIAGKRTLSKLNMFDFIVTIALGSILGTFILSDNISLLEGLTAITLLVGLQFIVAWLSVQSKGFRDLVKGSPKLVLYKGEYVRDAMQKTRITEEEIRFAARSQGYIDMSNVGTVILETNGDLTVTGEATPNASGLSDVETPPSG